MQKLIFGNRATVQQLDSDKKKIVANTSESS